MKFTVALSIAICVLAAPAAAETKEQAAVSYGKRMAMQERIRFLCLSKGFPFPTWEEQFPNTTEIMLSYRDSLPEFWRHGAAEGVVEINEVWSGSSDQKLVCNQFASIGRKR